MKPILALLLLALPASSFFEGGRTANGRSLLDSAAGRRAPARMALSQESVAPTNAFDHTHARWNRVLGKYVHGALFDYAALARASGELDAYLGELRAVRPAEFQAWSEKQRFAFWINAYNAFTIEKVVSNLPLGSIRDLDDEDGGKSVFQQKWIGLQALVPSHGAKPLSLDDIENEILRKRFRDARVHTAINCSALSCPPLRAEAFVAHRLEAQLDAQMHSFLADRKRNRFEREAQLAQLSKVFDWFRGDFARDSGSLRAFLQRFVDEQDAAFLASAEFRFSDYDWRLNATPPADKD